MKPATILVVEDDEATRGGLVDLLMKAGYDVRSASTFQQAASALKETTPTLLITDVRLGEFNGLQLLATSARPIPAIVVTGFDDQVIRAEAQRLGADYLLKPFSGKEITALIERKLAGIAANPSGGVRRSIRKPVTVHLPACIEDEPVRIVDVSYEGLGLELEHAARRALTYSFGIRLPSAALTIDVDLVWTSRRDDIWHCGARVLQADHEAALAWRELVDSVG